MVTTPPGYCGTWFPWLIRDSGYRTRLTGPCGPSQRGLQLRSPPSFARLLEPLAALPSARTMYNERGRGIRQMRTGGMVDPFAACQQELELRDLDPKTRLRFGQIVSAYQRWLQGSEVTLETA